MLSPDTDPIEVEVLVVGVSGATRLASEGEDVELDASEFEFWVTVDGIFQVAEDAMNGADGVTASWR